MFPIIGSKELSNLSEAAFGIFAQNAHRSLYALAQ
jgi:hypothetical protein